MVKNKEAETPVQPVKHHFKAGLIKIVVLVAIIAAGYGFWKNPQIAEQINAIFSSQKGENMVAVSEYQAQINSLQGQLAAIQNQLNELASRQNEVSAPADLTDVNTRMEALEKTNLNVIDSKADVAAVLGLITRMDKAEEKLDNLAKVTDEGALILTAAMLVKDSAERGGSFEYEMEVLQQIATGNLNAKEPLAVMSAYARDGIVTEQTLQKEFKTIYAQMLKEQKTEFDKTWKDRINSKLNEIVQIKRVNEDAPKFEANQGLELIKAQVKGGDIRAAVAELEKPSNADLLKDEKLSAWLKQAKGRVDFYNAIDKISAGSLAMMKINFIKNKNKPN